MNPTKKKTTAKKKVAKKKVAARSTRKKTTKKKAIPRKTLSRQAKQCIRYMVQNPAKPKYKCYQRFFPEAVDDDGARASCSRLLATANARAYLAEVERKLEERYEITDDKILGTLAGVAFVDPGEIFTDNGQIRQLDDMSPQARMCLQGIKTKVLSMAVEDGPDDIAEIQEIKLYNRLEALKHLATIRELFKGKGADAPGGTFYDMIMAKIQPSGKPQSVNKKLEGDQ